MSYLREMSRRADETASSSSAENAPAAFLTDYWNNPQRDIEDHVVYRNRYGMILLNRYPYANGHLLVALGDARPRLHDYEPEQRAALWRLVDVATGLVERALNPQGINIGVNQGEAAGAGVPGHLHAHLVPRWNGDTNFLAVVGSIRVIPDSLEIMAATYRDTVERLGLHAD